MVPCSNVSVSCVLVFFFNVGGRFHDCYPLISGFFLALLRISNSATLLILESRALWEMLQMFFFYIIHICSVCRRSNN